jgi:hypothetical protein
LYKIVGLIMTFLNMCALYFDHISLHYALFMLHPFLFPNSISSIFISFFFYLFFFFGGIWAWLKASCLVGRHSYPWATLPGLFFLSRLHICDVCLSESSVLITTTLWPPIWSIFTQMTWFHSYFWLDKYSILFIYSFVNGHQVWIYNLAIVNRCYNRHQCAGISTVC